MRKTTAIVRMDTTVPSRCGSSEVSCPWCGQHIITYPIPLSKSSIVNCDKCKKEFGISGACVIEWEVSPEPIFTYYEVDIFDPDNGSGKIPDYFLFNSLSNAFILIKQREADLDKNGFKIEIKRVPMTKAQFSKYIEGRESGL